MAGKENASLASPMAPLIAQFLYREDPGLHLERLTEAVRRYSGAVDPNQLPTKDSTLAQYFMTDALAEFKDKVRLPTQLCLIKAEAMPNSEIIGPSLHQTWNWKEAREVVGACKHMLIANDLMAAPLERQIRSKQFRGFLRAVQETMPADAIHFMNSGVVVNPAEFLRHQQATDGMEMMGGINVRLFRIEGTDGDCLMDTMGLAVFGLPDIQCHFRQLDCGEMAHKLYDIAFYLFGKGDVIKNGETVEGFDASQRWKCQHEMALVGPERVVLDLNPGASFAAGDRS
jgi:hypothetical protein